MAASDDLKAILDYYGLGALFDRVNTVITSDPTLVRQPEFLLNTVRDTDVYKQRFKGNEARRARGLPELSPADYVAIEDGYRQTLRANSMPRGFYDTTDDFSRFIGSDVRPNELNDRIRLGYSAVMEAEPGTKAELQRLYGLQDSDLAAFFLDPERFQQSDAIRKAEAAKIASEARRQAGISLEATQAEALAREGVTRDTAQQGFATISEQEGLFQAQMQGEEAITQAEQIGAVFGTNAAARKKITERRRRRTAQFEEGGGFAGGTTSGITGLSTVNQ
jgi:hypothetical protein